MDRSGCDVAGVERFFFAISEDAAPAFPAQVAGGRAGIINTSLPALSQGKFVAVMPFRGLETRRAGLCGDAWGRPSRRNFFKLKEIHVASSTEARKIDPRWRCRKSREIGANLIVQERCKGARTQLRITVKLELQWKTMTVLNEEFSGSLGICSPIEDKIYTKWRMLWERTVSGATGSRGRPADDIWMRTILTCAAAMR